MSVALFAIALAGAQAPGAVAEAPPPLMPRGPRQPATGAAPPELVPGPRFCEVRVFPSGPSQDVSVRDFDRCFLESDYPLAAFDARQQGVVAFRVEIGPGGRATACAVTASSGSAALDAATCALLERRIAMPYSPEARPRAMTFSGQFAWTLPARSPRDMPAAYTSYFTMSDYPAVSLRANEQGAVRFTIQVDAAGRPSGCEITRSSGAEALDLAACRIIRSRARYYPARDAEGRPVPGVDPNGLIIWRLPEE